MRLPLLPGPAPGQPAASGPAEPGREPWAAGQRVAEESGQGRTGAPWGQSSAGSAPRGYTGPPAGCACLCPAVGLCAHPGQGSACVPLSAPLTARGRGVLLAACGGAVLVLGGGFAEGTALAGPCLLGHSESTKDAGCSVSSGRRKGGCGAVCAAACLCVCVCVYVCVYVCVCTRTAPSAACLSSLPVLVADGSEPCSIRKAEDQGQAVVLKGRGAAREVTASLWCGCGCGACAGAGLGCTKVGVSMPGH